MAINFKLGKSKNVKLGDITLSEKQHDKLVTHIVDRLTEANEVRGPFVDRLHQIDIELSGFMKLDEDDKKRQRDNLKGLGPKTTDVNLQMVMTQLDEAVTYLLSVLVPDEGMYGAIAAADKQDVANGFSNLLNYQGLNFKHYKNYARGFLSQLKYNLGGWDCEWKTVHGNRITSNSDGSVGVKNEVVLQGNAIKALDMYNFIWDVSVADVVDVPSEGEFFATVHMYNSFKLQKMASEKEIFSIDRFIDQQKETMFYREKPIVHDISVNTGGTNWVSMLSGGDSKSLMPGFEMIHCPIWINPKEFGLSKEDEMQIWRITIVNSKYIVAATHLTNAHGMLPLALAMPMEDDLGLQTRGFGEILTPLQRFISGQFNIKQRADKKSLHGLVIYDSNVIPLLDGADLEGGKVPAKPVGQDKDLRRSIISFNDAPNTTGIIRDIEGANSLMQKMLPTDMAGQVASLERATQYQAAATVQGSNRRNHKIAKVVYDQSLTGLRFMMMYNVFQFQEEMEILDNDTGELLKVNPSEFRDTKIEFAISDGLKGIDRLHVSESLKEVINMMLQSQVASDQADIMAIIDYWLNIVGDKTDFMQFKFKSEIDKLPKELRDQAFALLQQAMAEQQAAEGGQAPATPGAV